MQNNFSKIPLFFSIIFFIFSCSVFFFFYKTLNNNNRKSQLAEIQWQTEALKRDEVKMLDYSIKIIEEERSQLENHFAKSSDIVPFLDTIEGLASKAEAKAEISSVDVLKDRDGLMVEINASGTFNSLYKFLILLENSPYELEFMAMNIQKETSVGAEKDKKDFKWNAFFRIKLLSFI